MLADLSWKKKVLTKFNILDKLNKVDTKEMYATYQKVFITASTLEEGMATFSQ